MRIVVHFVAIALIGTGLTLACLAEETARDGGSSTLSANPDGSRPPAGEDAAADAARLDNQRAPDSKSDSKAVTGEGGPKGDAVGRDFRPSSAGDKDSDAIDTRITVQPRRLGRRDAVREGDTKLRLHAPHIFRPRRLSAHEDSSRVTRDAIGLPVARHDGMEQGSGQRHDLPALVHNPAAVTTGFDANAGGSLGRPLSNANPIVRPAALNRGTINGTNLARPGFGPSSVGGPAKQVTGISGTTIRPKH